jgi:hypothetical protein
MAANALAISELARMAGRDDVAQKYREKHESLKEKINSILWDGEFYRAIHTDNLDCPSFDEVAPSQNARELIGYIPWCFGLAPRGRERAFEDLKSYDGFKSDFGLTTAQRNHPRYLYSVDHECLWNGYVWPFATSQVLRALQNLLENYDQDIVGEGDFYSILHTYAQSQRLIDSDGNEVCWIDEVKHPETNEWSSRKILLDLGWLEEKGGFERGKDYNHSTFCDIVLGGLLGIRSENGQISVTPHVPDEWDHFEVKNLWIGQKCYTITYERDEKGKHIAFCAI